jgi:hypothetical protein
MPVALSYGAMGLEFSVGQFAAAAWRHWRHPRRYLPGPGAPATGYVVRAAAPSPSSATAPEMSEELLWDV